MADVMGRRSNASSLGGNHRCDNDWIVDGSPPSCQMRSMGDAAGEKEAGGTDALSVGIIIPGGRSSCPALSCC